MCFLHYIFTYNWKNTLKEENSPNLFIYLFAKLFHIRKTGAVKNYFIDCLHGYEALLVILVIENTKNMITYNWRLNLTRDMF